MDVFLFIIIIVAIVTFGEIATKVGVPLTRRLADLLEGKTATPSAPAPPAELADAMESLENRLARIEDRLDFLEELKAPPHRKALPEGKALSEIGEADAGSGGAGPTGDRPGD